MRSRRFRVPPLDLLPAFEAAARHLSFTRAADELALTQSAVSRQIQALEEHVGTPLFERRARALELTAAGERLLRTTREVLAALDTTMQQLGQAPAARAIAVTTTPGFATLWLIPRLGEFTRAHPDVDVRIATTHELVPLERSDLDVALRYCAPEAAAGGSVLFGEHAFPVCSPALAAERPLERPADLSQHVLLHFDDPRAALFEWDPWLRAIGIETLRPAGHLSFSHYDQLIQAALAGQGVAMGRDPLVRDLLREGRLVAPFPERVASPRAYHLLVAERSAAREEVRAFVAWVTDRAAAEGAVGP